MTEEEAREWLAAKFGAQAVDRLARFVDLVRVENQRQSLISAATSDAIWSRHVVDSAQLLDLAGVRTGRWIDVGTGAGFPGVVVALLFDGATIMVEPRAKRATFLREACASLDIRARVEQARVERTAGTPDIISARAVASAHELFEMTKNVRSATTRYLLPRGRSGAEEVANLGRHWHGMFHVEQSVTDPASAIIVATGVTARCSASP